MGLSPAQVIDRIVRSQFLSLVFSTFLSLFGMLPNLGAARAGPLHSGWLLWNSTIYPYQKFGWIIFPNNSLHNRLSHFSLPEELHPYHVAR